MTPVGLVFVTTNEKAALIPALSSLYASKPLRPLEVVVVDNASSDGVGKEVAARWPEVQILTQGSRAGLPANLNRGIRATVSPYVMVCNPDLIFLPGAIDALAGFLDAHPRAGIVAPKLVSPEGNTRPSARRWYTVGSLLALKLPWAAAQSRSVRASVYEEWDYARARRVDWVPCPATMIRRSVLERVGLMDERFRLYFDDVDLSFRMSQEGWEVWCEPAAEIIHLEQRGSARPFSRAWLWHLRSLLQFWWKHKGLRPRIRPARPARTGDVTCRRS
ncbi:MAG: glycosyltransferase family 2 protein [Actinomycetota bacterium]